MGSINNGNGSAMKDVERGSFNGDGASHEEKLRNALTNTMTLSPELFEKIYLSPKGNTKGDLRKTFANPTPIAITGFVVGLLPLSCEFMGWRGSGGTFATQTTTASVFFGGVLLTFGGIGEFFLGNSFPCLVFFAYGAHFFTYACAFIPWFGSVAWNAASTPGNDYSPGPTFAAGFGFYPLALAMLSFIFLICSLRTNLVFVMIFVCATMGFGFAAGSLWATAQGSAAYGNTLLIGCGACFFAADMLGWYLLLAIMIAVMELPVGLGDLFT
ncbi:hypothetical protein M409DRAFT_64633 [Zasmidium cellare ATCC 36951]|uniref:GPR1/FUN34/YaaH-class plasma membrane protein n=1 Tax=Zasmidium cellare ATCC 36951 TaxID=1080233 RepID=A0A6A6CQS7_ZASCE|nr:uncharacterized protein M409DRAFT_64633 [Zasmidium cellare ATCC 36951]KAF2169514.1 hypothetical protein M409DRAFT_64633 [Zasmidium cellare ATCC 36951]